MKFFAFICFVGLAHSGLVRRDADPAPDAAPDAAPEADPGYGHYTQGAVSAPVCHSVPEKTCVPRQIETPRKVCQQTYDEIVDTTITQHCEEVITTTCQQTSQTSSHTSAVVGHDSKVVATGVVATPAVTVAHGHGVVAGHGVVRSHGAVGHGHVGYGKRDADAEPEADAEAIADPDADADAGYGYGYGYAAHPKAVSAPVCSSVPVKQCKEVPVHTPRKVAKTVCATHVDVTTVEDCKEVITTQCSQTSQKVAHHSAVVGHDTRVGPAAVVAAHGHAAVVAPVAVGYGHGHAVAGHAVAGHSGVYHG